jgi:hypothetical protein
MFNGRRQPSRGGTSRMMREYQPPRDHARPSEDTLSVVPFARTHLARQAGYSDDTSKRMKQFLGARTLLCAILILVFFAPVSKSEVRYCGQPFDVQAARIRWTNARQSRPTSEEADQICRAYFNQFYEAVQARQAVSECAGGGEQKDAEMPDGQIEAFNNLIATYCGT